MTTDLHHRNHTYLVHVSDTLSKVELGVLGGVHSLNLDEALVAVLGDLASTRLAHNHRSFPTFCNRGSLP